MWIHADPDPDLQLGLFVQSNRYTTTLTQLLCTIWNKVLSFGLTTERRPDTFSSHPQLVYSLLVESCDGTCCTWRLENLFLALSWVRKLGVEKNNIDSGHVCVIITVIEKYTFAFQRVNITNLTSRIKCTLFARNYFRCLFCTIRGFTFSGARKSNHSVGLILTGNCTLDTRSVLTQFTGNFALYHCISQTKMCENRRKNCTEIEITKNKNP